MVTKIKFQAKTVDTVTVNSVSLALNGPKKGIVYDWREAIAPFALRNMKKQSPVNDERNTMSPYRKGGMGVTGTYRDGLEWQRRGNQYGLGIKFLATAAHSKYVEDGRGRSDKKQYFSQDLRYGNKPAGTPFWHDSTKRRVGSRSPYGFGRFLEKSSAYWMRELVVNTPSNFNPNR